MKPVVWAPHSLGPLMVKLNREPWAVNFRRPWWKLGSLLRLMMLMFLKVWVESQKVSNLMKPPRENSAAARAVDGTTRASTTRISIVFFIVPPFGWKVVTNFSFP